MKKQAILAGNICKLRNLLITAFFNASGPLTGCRPTPLDFVWFHSCSVGFRSVNMRVKEKFPVDLQMIQRTGVLFWICESQIRNTFRSRPCIRRFKKSQIISAGIKIKYSAPIIEGDVIQLRFLDETSLQFEERMIVDAGHRQKLKFDFSYQGRIGRFEYRPESGVGRSVMYFKFPE